VAQIDNDMPSSNGAEMGEQQAVETVLARPVRVVDVERPWLWLRAGWRDFLAAKSISLTFGFMISAASLILISLLWQVDLLPYVLPLAAGFMFLAPAVAICFYEISRRLERKEPVRLEQVATAWRPHVSQIAFMGLVMVLFQMVWIRLATLIFALFFGPEPASWDHFITALVFSTDGIPFLVIGTLVGGVLAILSFAISVTAFPMLLDRDVGAAAAIATSVHAVAKNWRVMTGWAALIVLFTVAGLATLCLGLAVTMPLIGHASWHAYRDLVADED
jgi:uncharacterized membrane protein